jgi:hypothetical protein
MSMTDQRGQTPDHAEGAGATIEEAIENATKDSRSGGVATPPEQARSGEAPVERLTRDDDSS